MSSRLSGTLLVGAVMVIALTGNAVAESARAADKLTMEKLTAPGLHNVFRLGERIVSGSGPESPEAFASLAKLGVKAIVSVDGAAPDVAEAKKHGLVYYHVPIGYAGIAREQQLQIARALHDTRGLVYIHCHHGKHRGPAAAAIGQMCVDPTIAPKRLLEYLKQAGTDPKYAGLYQVVEKFERPSEEAVRATAAPPEKAKVADLTPTMAELGDRFERLKKSPLLSDAGRAKSDRAARAELARQAVLVEEAFQEIARTPDSAARPEEYRKLLSTAESAAKELAATWGAADVERQPDEAIKTKIDRAWKRLGDSCVDCHAAYRDGR
ncbi:MAG TPA: hypothetical protein PLV92_09395 [Pirellulaceae bacterium]|nr:hypothetical protein [Pirellulaceae bacterium]